MADRQVSDDACPPGDCSSSSFKPEDLRDAEELTLEQASRAATVERELAPGIVLRVIWSRTLLRFHQKWRWADPGNNCVQYRLQKKRRSSQEGSSLWKVTPT